MRPACLIALLFLVACTLDNPGLAPPPGRLYFPTAVAVVSDYLIVANSNFDIRYSHGSLQAYSLDALNEQVDRCIADASTPGCLCRADSPCVLPDPAALLADEVLIDSFASAVAWSETRGRMYVPTRSNGGLTFVDFAAGEFDCGQTERICGSGSVVGVDPGPLKTSMPAHPTAVVTGRVADVGLDNDDGEYVLVGDRDGAVSLFVDRRSASDVPQLHHVRRGLPGEVTGIAVSGSAAFVSTVDRAGQVADKRVTQLGFVHQSQHDFYAVYVSASLAVSGFGGGSTVRDVAFVPGAPADLIAITWNPNALVLVNLADSRAFPTELRADDVIALGTGPSRVQVGRFGPHARVLAFVSNFDSREVSVIDVGLRRLVSVIQGLAGPFALALDEQRSRLYVGDFRSSTVRIVDLAPLVDGTAAAPDPGSEPPAARVIAVLGRPAPPQVLQ